MQCMYSDIYTKMLCTSGENHNIVTQNMIYNEQQAACSYTVLLITIKFNICNKDIVTYQSKSLFAK